VATHRSDGWRVATRSAFCECVHPGRHFFVNSVHTSLIQSTLAAYSSHCRSMSHHVLHHNEITMRGGRVPMSQSTL